MRSSTPVTTALTRRRRPARRAAAGQLLEQRRRHRSLMPTVIRKTPSARPLNGSVTTSTSLRYSVSAMSRPATSAPRIGDRPTDAVTGGEDHDQQADRPGTARASWSAPPGRTGRAGGSGRPQDGDDDQRALDRDTGQGRWPPVRRPRRSGTASAPAPDPRTAASQRGAADRALVPEIGSTSAVEDIASARPAIAPAAPAMPNDQQRAADQRRRAEQLGGADAEHHLAASPPGAGSSAPARSRTAAGRCRARRMARCPPGR